MSKNKEEQARREGMAYAYRLAETQGIEALKKDLAMRNALEIPVGIPKTAIDQFVTNVKNQVTDCMTILMLSTLHDEFGFGAERCRRVMERFQKKSDCILEDYTTWNDEIKTLDEEIGIKLNIRANDKDVRI